MVLYNHPTNATFLPMGPIMYEVYEVNTGETIETYTDSRMAWSLAWNLNDDFSDAYGYEYSVREVA